MKIFEIFLQKYLVEWKKCCNFALAFRRKGAGSKPAGVERGSEIKNLLKVSLKFGQFKKLVVTLQSLSEETTKCENIEIITIEYRRSSTRERLAGRPAREKISVNSARRFNRAAKADS